MQANQRLEEITLVTVDRRTLLAWLGGSALGAAFAGRAGFTSAAAADRTDVNGGITVLTGASVIDGTNAPPMANATLVLAGDRILAVGENADVPTIAGVRMLDLTGKFIIPGLWDLHTHYSDVAETFPPMHLVYGVSGIREMRGSAATHDARRRIERGDLTGPNMIISSKVLDGPDSANPFSVRIDTDDDARKAVRAARAEGADLIKVYSFLHRDEHAAIAREAARVGLWFAGHSPSLMPVQEVLAAGQHSIEHNYGMHLSTSTRRDEYFDQIAQLPDDVNDPRWWGGQVPGIEREAVDTYSAQLTAELAGQFVERDAWHVPTLAVESAVARHPSKLLEDPRLRELMERFIPPTVRTEWVDYVNAWPPWTPEREAAEQKYFDAKLELVRDFADAGGPIGTGTDTGFPLIFAGLSTHDELDWLVAAGLSPLRAVQAATRDAARCAGQDEIAGTITAGKRADLVVLDGDPLADIRNSREIHAVVARGRYYGPAERQQIFDELERVAKGD